MDSTTAWDYKLLAIQPSLAFTPYIDISWIQKTTASSVFADMLDLTLSYSQTLLGLLLIIITVAVCRRYFSSLSQVPGPFWASITRLWHAYHISQGDHSTTLLALHEKYSHFVRIAPNEVSVSHPDGPVILLQKLLRKVRALRATNLVELWTCTY